MPLYDIIFSVGGDIGREGFTLDMEPEQAQEVRKRLETGQATGVVRDWVMFDLCAEGMNYEELLETIRLGEEPPKPWHPDCSKHPWLIQMFHKSGFFGLRKARDVAVTVFLDPGQEKQIRTLLKEDRRLSDFDLVDNASNVDLEEFLEILDKRVGPP